MTAETPVSEYPIITVTDERLTAEQADLLAELRAARHFLRLTARDLDDEQAGRRTTVSELCIGGLIKHVISGERTWATFIEHGPSAMPDWMSWTEADYLARADQFRMLPGETLDGVLADYADAARATDELVAGLTDLNVSQPLPPAPWFTAGGSWTARRTVLHIIAETTQHAGHADIIREALDGAKSMG